jgi:hypothetical protein
MADLQTRPATGNAALQLAALETALGNLDEAFRWLAFEPAHGTLPWVRVDPEYMPLREIRGSPLSCVTSTCLTL